MKRLGSIRFMVNTLSVCSESTYSVAHYEVLIALLYDRNMIPGIAKPPALYDLHQIYEVRSVESGVQYLKITRPPRS